MSDEFTTYLVVHENKTQRRIKVPSSWKVTFGPAVKGHDRGAYAGNKMPMCLRFYENETKQRALFTDVVSFRDMSIEVEELKESIQEKTGYMEVDGARKATTFSATVKEWVNPDNEEKQGQLPSATEVEDFDVK